MNQPRDLVVAGVLGAALSGVPSISWTLLTRDDVLASTRAAGTLLPGRRSRPSLVGGLVVHLVLSAIWTLVMGAISRHRRLGPVSGGLIGLAIAALDLGIIGRRYPAIAALPQAPQWADHVVFGAVVGHRLPRR